MIISECIMKRLVLVAVLSFLYPSLVFSQENYEDRAVIDSLAVSQSNPVMVTLDNDTGNKLENIEHFAEPYSIKDLFLFPDGFDSVNLGFWIALLALIVGLITYWAQKKTESHTRNAPIEYQKERFKDLIRHFYRNLIVSIAFKEKYLDDDNKVMKKSRGQNQNSLLFSKWKSHPSESHLLKLKLLPEDEQNLDSEYYSVMHEIKLLLRNYDTEVDVALSHLCVPTIKQEDLNVDFDNLLFKPFYLIRRMVSTEAEMNRISGKIKYKNEKEREITTRAIGIILSEHINKLYDNIERLISPDTLSFIQSKLKTGDLLVAQRDVPSKTWLRSEEEFKKLLQALTGNETERYFEKSSISPHIDNKKKKFFSDIKTGLKEDSDQGIKETFINVLSNELSEYYNLMKAESWNKKELERLVSISILIDIAIERSKIGMIHF